MQVCFPQSDQCDWHQLAVIKVDPKYAERARRDGIEGMVVLNVTIPTNSLPTNVRVAKPLHRDLDQEAVKAVHQWRFEPAI